MIKLCINCNTENPVDAVTCSGCGMSLTRAPTGQTADEARRTADAQRTTEQAGEIKDWITQHPWAALALIALALALLAIILLLCFLTPFLQECGGPNQPSWCYL